MYKSYRQVFYKRPGREDSNLQPLALHAIHFMFHIIPEKSAPHHNIIIFIIEL